MSDVKTMKKEQCLKAACRSKQRKKEETAVKVLFIGIIMILLFCAMFLICGLKDRSIYQIIVRNGYTGTQEQWLASLVGEEVDTNAESAYELAVANNYKGSEAEWIELLTEGGFYSVNASPYEISCKNGFKGSLVEWLTYIADKPEKLGKSQKKGIKTEYELACEYGYSGTFIEWLVSVTHAHVFK